MLNDHLIVYSVLLQKTRSPGLVYTDEEFEKSFQVLKGKTVKVLQI